MLDRGDVEMYVHIRDGFSADIKSGKKSELQLIVDGTDSSRAAVIVAQINQITADFSTGYFKDKIRLYVLAMENQGYRMKKPIELKERMLFNPDLASRNFFLPGILGMLIVMTTMTLTSMSIVKERETGTIEQITVSPVRPAEYIAGKVVPFALVSFFDTFVISLIEIFWFKVPFNGSFLLLLLIAVVFVFATTAVGLFISTISRTQQQALLSVFLFFLPALMFSGFVFPIYAMPVPIQIISYVNPVRYFMTLIRGVFLKGVGLDVLWPDLLLLALLGGAMFYLSVRRFTRRMD
jgi:ABC-2 type transport system permease protein